MPPVPEKVEWLDRDGAFHPQVLAWDFSSALEAAVYDRQEMRAGLQRLKGRKFLLVPGLGHDMAKGYFTQSLAVLRAIDPDASIVDVDRFGKIEDNARTVLAAVRSRPGPLVIVAHSKGGIDVLQALVDDPRSAAKVEAVLLLQAPYWGSPLGDSPLALAVNDMLAYLGIERYVRQTRELLAQISTSGRRNLPRLPPALAAKIFSVATSYAADDARRRDPRFLILPRESDGTVPLASQIVPCSRFGMFKNMGHMDTVRAREGAATPPGVLVFGAVAWVARVRAAKLERSSECSS
jgi:hypothetical protein